MNSSLDVVTFGEAMLLLVADRPGPIEQAQSLSQAHRRRRDQRRDRAGAAGPEGRLGQPARHRFDGRATCWPRCRREGIDCSHVRCDAGAAHRLPVQGPRHRRQRPAGRIPPQGFGREPDGRRRHRRGLAALGAPPACDRRVPGASPTPACRPRSAAMRADARRRPHDLVRPNLRPTLWASPETHARTRSTRLAAQADWVLPGLEEGRFLTGERHARSASPRFYRQRGAKLVVVKLGPEGAYFDSESGSGPRRGLSGASRWSTPWAPATASRSAWSARCSKAAASARPCAAAPGSARARCRCSATPRACRRARNCEEAGL